MSGVLHVDRRLFPAQGRPRRDRHRLLFACRANQFHLRIILNQRNDLAEPRLG